MFHPTLLAPDLVETAAFFRRVFGQESSSSLAKFPTIESTFGMFTTIRDVLIDTISPIRIKELMNVEFFSKEGIPHLSHTGWYVDQDRIADLFYRLKDMGIRCVGPDSKVRDKPPVQGGDPAPFTLNGQINYVTSKLDTGVTYQFVPTSFGRSDNPNKGSHLAIDERMDRGWTLPPEDPADPLGIVRCSHHTFLTREPARALKFMVDVLGGTIIHEGRDELRATSSTYVALSDATFEYAVPDPGSDAERDLDSYPVQAEEPGFSHDTYHALTWTVADLDKAAAHLESAGVRIRARSGKALITEPSTSMGIPWGFASVHIPGDPRFA
ncbi:VOC family protein [Novosphingobium malaysiense]|uniref:VOC family protein n=1 Tax=Novosphingobium malaysiense TaxID=1348853 RepID=UPI000B07E27C|nr:VOC family protein [Novosphingobium malaysiense]